MSQSTVSNEDRVYRDDTLDAYHRGVERAIAVMHYRLGDPLTVDDLAEAAFMSHYHFIRVFAKITGVSPARFLAAVRIQEAKRLLLKTDRSVTDICFDVGYNSLGSFTRIFTDFVGFPPVEFRQLSLSILNLTIDDVVRFLSLRPCRTNPPSITGEVVCDRSLALVTVALFSTAVPRSLPIECNCLTDSRRFSFACLPPQDARIFAAGMSATATMEDVILLNAAHIRVGTIPLPCLNRNSMNLELRQQRAIEPPVVVAIPLLIAESMLAGT